MNEIVVYQPNEVTRLEVRVERDTVWLNQAQLCELFGVVKSNISYHLTNIFKTGELVRSATVQEIRTVQTEGGREVSRVVDYFNLDVIISLGFRVNTQKGIQFRQWANKILKEYLVNGAAINRREIALADEMDRRLMGHEKRLSALEDQVKLIVNAALPPPEKVFLNGEVLDAQAELTRIIKTAKRRVILIDNYIDERTLLLLGARAEKVACTIYTLKPESPKLAPALKNYAIEYPTKPIEIKGFKKAHDRFLIVDDTLWHIGASLKDAGLNLFAMMKMSLSPDVILAVL